MTKFPTRICAEYRAKLVELSMHHFENDDTRRTGQYNMAVAFEALLLQNGIMLTGPFHNGIDLTIGVRGIVESTVTTFVSLISHLATRKEDEWLGIYEDYVFSGSITTAAGLALISTLLENNPATSFNFLVDNLFSGDVANKQNPFNALNQHLDHAETVFDMLDISALNADEPFPFILASQLAYMQNMFANKEMEDRTANSTICHTLRSSLVDLFEFTEQYDLHAMAIPLTSNGETLFVHNWMQERLSRFGFVSVSSTIQQKLLAASGHKLRGITVQDIDSSIAFRIALRWCGNLGAMGMLDYIQAKEVTNGTEAVQVIHNAVVNHANVVTVIDDLVLLCQYGTVVLEYIAKECNRMFRLLNPSSEKDLFIGLDYLAKVQESPELMLTELKKVYKIMEKTDA